MIITSDKGGMTSINFVLGLLFVHEKFNGDVHFENVQNINPPMMSQGAQGHEIPPNGQIF